MDINRVIAIVRRLREEPERTPAYKAMHKKLYPRGSTIDAKTGKNNAIMGNVGGFSNPKNRGKKRKVMGEDLVIEREDSPYEKASSGALSGKTRSSGASKTEPKTGFGRKAHRNSAAMIIRAKRKAERSGKKLSDDSAADLAHKGWASSVKHHKSSMTPEQQKRRQKLADTPYSKLSKDEQDKDKVSAKAIMSVHDKQKKKTVNEDAPTMSMGGGGIAGSVEHAKYDSNFTPPVDKKKKKDIYLGLHSRKRWLDYINGKGSGKS